MSDTEHPTHDIDILQGLRPADRMLAAQGYWDAFARKLRYPLGPECKATAFIGRVLDPGHAISAIARDGTFLGVAGFKTPDGAFVGGGLRDLAAVYGWVGACWRGIAVSALERPCESGVLLMDGIFVMPEARGRGVGTALLAAIERRAAEAGLARIRLDVIDTNPRARALYEREGFKQVATTSLGPLAPVFGFSHAAQMSKAVRQ
ncbi:GNAT family N-acetyltransferase [Jannaschia aquimarina]|uniref:YpeA protein n=1 Tax=Jannaschia aquimarina TaxID=935700 RepID=A0A0D1ELB4_9RHOB|nr:GNAT family N-acetyltransferase [Jannaschia aquimarina]KIT16565.1 Acetyltransferase YpeA [Jannaschia aquimarina]SNT41756.1 Acetyltransferase (GNAT) family protein [Jannaschia aquimarina]